MHPGVNPELSLSWFIAITCSMGSCVLIVLCFTTILIYQLFMVRKTTKISKSYIWISILSALCLTISTCIDTTHMIYTYFIPQSLTKATHAMMCISDTFYYIGDLLFYTLLIKRVYDAFNNTTHALSKPLLIFFCIILIISSITVIYFAFAMAFLFKSGADFILHYSF